MPSSSKFPRLSERHSRISWVLLDQMVVSGGNFLLSVLIARFLGITAYGEYVLLWIAATVLFTLQQSLIIRPMMSFGPKLEEHETLDYYSTLTFQQLIFGLAGSTLMSGFVYFLLRWNDLDTSVIVPFYAALFTWLWQDYVRRYFFTIERAKPAFYSDVLAYITRIGLLVAMSMHGHLNLGSVFWLIAATSLLGLIPGWSFLSKLRISSEHFTENVRSHWRMGKWLSGSRLLQMATSEGPFAVAGAMLGAEVVGGMRATWNVLAMIHILFQGMDNLVPVQGAKLFAAKGTGALVAYLRKFTLLGGALTVFAMLVVVAVPEFWVNLFYGEEFLKYAWITRIQAIIFVLIFLAHPLTYGLCAIEYTRPEMYVNAVATLVGAILIFPMTQWWGITGNMAAFGIAQAVAVYLMWRAFFERTRQMETGS